MPKSWIQSKTIAFNLVVAWLAVLAEQSDLLKSLLSEKHYAVVMLLVSIANVCLRLVTSVPIAQPDKKD